MGGPTRMRIVFVGPPGAGKGTQSLRLLNYLQIPHISTGDMLRRAIAEHTPSGRIAEQYMNKGLLVPDDLMLTMVSQRLDLPDCEDGALFDGFPRTVPQAEALTAMLDQRGTPLDMVIELRVPDAEVIRRMMARGRSDDREEIVAERIRAYWNQTRPLLDFYEHRGIVESVEGLGTPDEVFNRIKRVLAQPKQCRQS